MACNCKKKREQQQQDQQAKVVVQEATPQSNQSVTDLTPDQKKTVNEIIEKINQVS